MEVHVLNGDALGSDFPFREKIIVCREGLIDGPVNEKSLEKFWDQRSRYVTGEFGASRDEYRNKVQRELEQLFAFSETDNINLWFEHDLFCQVNMWFILSLIEELNIRSKVFRVSPPTTLANVWDGFGSVSSLQLTSCFESRVQFSKTDIQLGTSLWEAYQQNDLMSLENFSQQKSDCFHYLAEVCDAHIERANGMLGRPKQRLRQIQQSGIKDFGNIFLEFRKTEAIYGFGDLQVKKMLEELESN
jgi:hypothetical protein